MDRERELLKGNTPTLIMAVLRDEPLHGYAIAREIERRSGAALRCKEGTLYPALQALEREGLIRGQWEQGPNGRGRKVYSLTEEGLTRLAEERRVWEQFAAGVGKVLGGGDQDDAGVPQPGARGLVPGTVPG